MPACFTISALTAAAIVLAQPPGVTPVQAGYDDVSPLSHSLAVPRADLRVPMNFERVYRISSELNLFGRHQEYFARASGGLWAIFPRSSYIRTEAGVVPKIPAGTIWVIGDPTTVSRPAPERPDPRVIAPLDLRIDTRPPPPGAPTTIEPELRTVWTSETYRQQRVGKLLDDCAAP